MAESQQGSTTSSGLVSQWIPPTDSPGLLTHPTVLLKIFFSRKAKPSPAQGNLWRAQQMKPPDWLAQAAIPILLSRLQYP